MMEEMNIAKSAPEADQELIAKFLSENVSFLGPDPEIVCDHHMQPRSPREEAILGGGEVDTQLMRDVRMSLNASLDEAFEVVEQTAASPAA